MNVFANLSLIIGLINNFAFPSVSVDQNLNTSPVLKCLKTHNQCLLLAQGELVLLGYLM